MSCVFEPDEFGLCHQLCPGRPRKPGMKSQTERKRDRGAVGRRERDRHPLTVEHVVEHRRIAVGTGPVRFALESYEMPTTRRDTPGREPAVSVNRAALPRGVGQQLVECTGE